jgi:translocation and assembly module TamA
VLPFARRRRDVAHGWTTRPVSVVASSGAVRRREIRAAASLSILIAIAPIGAAGCSTIERALMPLGLVTPEGYVYDVELAGAGDELKERLEQESVLIEKRYEPPPDLQGLQRRVEEDRETFLRLLRSRGWYDGSVRPGIDTTRDPPLVVMNVNEGPRYVLTRFDVVGLPPQAEALATDEGVASLGVALGEPALAETILAAESRLLVRLQAQGYAFAKLEPREARIDRDAHTIEVTERVDAGPETRFGDVTIEGLSEVDEEYVRNRLEWEHGQTFSPVKLEETRKALFASGVFTAASITYGTREDVGPDGLAPIRIELVEGKMHGIGAGLSYSSADGFGGRAFWEHRNLTGRADKLRAEIDYSQQEAEGGISYRRPDWLMRRQNLLLEARLDADEPPAYERYAASVSAGVEHPITSRLSATGGVLLEQADVNSAADPDGTRRFTLIGVPLGLRYDGSNSLLDPTRGHRTLLSLTPWFGVAGDGVEMLVARLTESFYVPLTSDGGRVWATRITIGSVVGPERIDIPADKRMYAGGGGSLRGYQYQMAGPLVDVPCPPDSDDTCDPDKPHFRPLGGRSLLSVGTELRWKVAENIGIVPFVEGAGVYESGFPDFKEEFLVGAGIGVRYFTVAGPLRFDIAFPVTPRQSDGLFEIYISLGQAF